MNRIKLSKSVIVSNAENGKYSQLYQKVVNEFEKRLSVFVRGKEENILVFIQKNIIQTIESNLLVYVKSYITNYDIEEEKIIGRANRKIDIELLKVELITVDSGFENCVFMLHYHTKELYFKAFTGNSVIVSQLTDGLHTIMVDFDSKEVAVEYLDVKQMN